MLRCDLRSLWLILYRYRPHQLIPFARDRRRSFGPSSSFGESGRPRGWACVDGPVAWRGPVRGYPFSSVTRITLMTLRRQFVGMLAHLKQGSRSGFCLPGHRYKSKETFRASGRASRPVGDFYHTEKISFVNIFCDIFRRNFSIIPLMSGACCKTRTCDLSIISRVLYQLS